MTTLEGRRGGRASEKSGARDMAMDAVGTAWEKQYKAALEQWESEGRRGPRPDPKSFGKDAYRDEEFEEGELLRGKQDDRDESMISQHGRWGSRATDKAGARDARTFPSYTLSELKEAVGRGKLSPETLAKAKKEIAARESVSENYRNKQYYDWPESTDKAGAKDFATDPPVSEAQRKAMWAAKSGNSTLGIGIPKSVGAEFAKADPGGKLP